MTYKEYIAHHSLVPFYAHWRLYPHDNNYNICFSYQFKDRKKISIIAEALQKLVEKKAYLRQTFDFVNEKLIARIHDHLPAQINVFNILSDDFDRTEQKILNEQHDITQTSSVKLNIIQFNDCSSSVAIFNIHHILMDASSIEHFIHDLNRTINKESLDDESAKDYILQIEKEKHVKTIDHSHIENYLTHINEVAQEDLYPKLEHNTSKYHYTASLSIKQIKLREFSSKYEISIFNLLLLSYALFIHKLFYKKSFIVNYPINTRKNKMTDGSFVQMLPFSLAIKDTDTYLDFIKTHLENMSLFKSFANYENNTASPLQQAPTFAASFIAHPDDLRINNTTYVAKTYAQIASAILSIKYREYGDTLFFTCDADSLAFPEHFAQTILPRFTLFVEELIKKNDHAIGTIPIISSVERDKLLGYSHHRGSQQKTVHALVDDYAQLMPGQPAIWYNGDSITYHELNQKANCLACYLLDRYSIKHSENLSKGTVIGVMLNRGIEVYIAFLAILKIGAVFLPLELDDPEERLLFMLKDSQASMLLTQQTALQSELMSKISLDVLILDDQKNSIFNQTSIYHLASVGTPDDLAYIMYTSGTTGHPKGVQIQHSGIVNLVKDTNYVHVQTFDHIIQASKLIFDASTFEIWSALLNGATSYVLDQNVILQPKLLSSYIRDHKISILYLTAGLFHEIVSQDCSVFSNLKYLYIGGEPVRPELVKKLLEYPNLTLISITNGYGPTECTTFSTTYTILSVAENMKSVPIGKPIAGVPCYVLDEDAKMLPFGAIGELCVGGPGVARGYLNHPELTRKKFILNEFVPGEKIFRTGDLARYLSDGNIELLGRMDKQIKIRGYRIELEEIESYLSAYPGIRRAILSIKNDDKSQKWLVAYFVTDDHVQLALDQLVTYLKTCLPSYMIPTFYVQMPQIPLTTNGKIDYKALPLANYTHIYPKQKPEDFLESKQIDQRIIEIWKETLGLEQIGIDDNFFDVGGNSLLLIRLHSKLEEMLNRKIPISSLFLHTTIRAHSQYIMNEHKKVNAHLQRARARAQKRLIPERNSHKSEITS